MDPLSFLEEVFIYMDIFLWAQEAGLYYPLPSAN